MAALTMLRYRSLIYGCASQFEERQHLILHSIDRQTTTVGDGEGTLWYTTKLFS